MHYYYMDYSFLSLTIASEKGKIVRVCFGKQEYGTYQKTPVIAKAVEQLEEYVLHKRKEFSIPYVLKGTPFQEKVWKELEKIPYGEVKSYQEIARAIGNEKASRAVGMAIHNNPQAILVPCHRVIGKNHTLVGFAGGLPIKEKLLELEKEI